MLLLFTILGVFVSQQDRPVAELTPRAYVAAALDILEKNSIKRHDIDWTTLRAEVMRRVESAETIPATYDAIRFAIRSLNDHHSSFLDPTYVATLNQRGATLSPSPGGHLVGGRLGHVIVPAFDGSDADAMKRTARRIQGLIRQLDKQHVCGWIVDLRPNHGGNMWPMLAGIGPVLGEGTVGAFVDGEGGKGVWNYRNGSSGIAARLLVTVDDAYTISHVNAPVAVLISRTTASSGEGIAVAFRGRPNTKFFGQTTHGLATANAMFRLADGAAINLTSALMADRNGNTYPDGIHPDKDVTWTDRSEIPSAVSAWLLAQPACRN